MYTKIKINIKNLNPSEYSHLIFFALLGLLMVYLNFDTGLHSDDYSTINSAMLNNFLLLTPDNLGWIIYFLPTYLTYWSAYLVFGYEVQWAYDLIKALSSFSSVLLCWHFFKIFLSPIRSIAASIFFVLLPVHDAANYWYMVAPYIFWPSVIMFSYYLLEKNRFILGSILGMLGAFSGYFSPPYTFGLSAIWFIKGEYRKGFFFITPGIVYVLYYFFIKIQFPLAERRISVGLDPLGFIKGFLLQVVGSLDSFVGPSAFIKIYYSISEIGFISFLIAIALLMALWFLVGCRTLFIGVDDRGRVPLLLGVSLVFLLSLLMFSLTGLYIPSPFNLGNRTLVYGSLLFAVVLASLPLNRRSLIVVWIIFILPTLGLSDHWKVWNQNQLLMLKNIRGNSALSQLKPTDTLIISGHIYSKLGPYSHIEMFGSPWVTSWVFKVFSGKENVVAINQSTIIQDHQLIDAKFGGRYSLENKFYIYDTERNSLELGSVEAVQKLINYQRKDVRHWIQLTNGTFIESLILQMSPRLSYLFIK